MNQAQIKEIRDIAERVRSLNDDYMGFGYKEIEAAFARVSNPDDWKAPIEAIIPAEILAITKASIMFYTATDPQVLAVGQNRYHIASEGYRMGPFGDH